MKVSEEVNKILKQYNVDPNKALWNCHGTGIMLHKYCEEIGARAGVEVIEYITEKIEGDNVVIKCHAKMNDKSVFSYGESSPKNSKNAYPVAMAEKRAFDRCVLKLVGLHGHIYAMDEMPDTDRIEENLKVETKTFKPTIAKPKIVKPIVSSGEKIDDIYIATQLDVIEKNPNNKNSTTLRSDLENLKTRINKAGYWDAFIKSNNFLKFNALRNQITKKQRS